MILRMCAWHEGGQLVLPCFLVTHSCCPVCLAQQMGLVVARSADVLRINEEYMKRPSARWPQLIQDGGWKSVPSGGYFPFLIRTLPSGIGQCVFHDGDRLEWGLEQEGVTLMWGDLDDVLETAENPANIFKGG